MNLTAATHSFNVVIKRHLNRNILWALMLIVFSYQVQKANLGNINPATFMAIIFSIGFFLIQSDGNKKVTGLNVLLLTTIVIRFNIQINDWRILISFIFFLLSLLERKKFTLFSIGSLILTPQYAPFIIFYLINEFKFLIKNEKIQTTLNLIFITVLVFFTITQTGIFSTFYRDIFDSFYKPMNIIFFLGILTIAHPNQHITNLMMTVFLTGFELKEFSFASPTPNIFFAIIIATLFSEFLKGYRNNLITNNLLLIIWFFFGALF